MGRVGSGFGELGASITVGSSVLELIGGGVWTIDGRGVLSLNVDVIWAKAGESGFAPKKSLISFSLLDYFSASFSS